jgi:hypothetical protein
MGAVGIAPPIKAEMVARVEESANRAALTGQGRQTLELALNRSLLLSYRPQSSHYPFELDLYPGRITRPSIPFHFCQSPSLSRPSRLPPTFPPPRP